MSLELEEEEEGNDGVKMVQIRRTLEKETRKMSQILLMRLPQFCKTSRIGSAVAQSSQISEAEKPFSNVSCGHFNYKMVARNPII